MSIYTRSGSHHLMKLKSVMFVFLLTLLIGSAAVSVIAFADSQIYTSAGFHYVIEDESVSIVDFFGKEKTVEVPSSIAGLPVSKICSGAFTGVKNLESITLPDTIMVVERGAFKEGQSVAYYDGTGMNSENGEQDGSESANDNRTADSEPNVTGNAVIQEKSTSATYGSKSNGTNVSVDEYEMDVDTDTFSEPIKGDKERNTTKTKKTVLDKDVRTVGNNNSADKARGVDTSITEAAKGNTSENKAAIVESITETEKAAVTENVTEKESILPAETKDETESLTEMISQTESESVTESAVQEETENIKETEIQTEVQTASAETEKQEKTSGSGSWLLFLAGGIIVVAAILLFVRKRSRKR